ncbi:MAG: 4Fe-4S binding protein [Candidatus Saccharicenans sp.]
MKNGKVWSSLSLAIIILVLTPAILNSSQTFHSSEPSQANLVQPAAGAGPQSTATPAFFDFLLRPKFLIMLIIATIAFVLLATNKMNNRIKIPILLLSTFLYGISANLGIKFFAGFVMHPSPICAATKSILYGFRMPMIVTLAVILFLTLIGPKLFCGYVCPVGAIQELLAMAADRLGFRRKKLSFRLTQTIRVMIFLAFIFLSWTAVIHTTSGGRAVALSLYDYINAFHGYEISLQPTFLDNLFHFLPFILTLVFALLTYRPFCYLVCPIGLLTNLVEQIAIFRVVKNRDHCVDCQNCAAKAPCPALEEILKEARLRPDCFACTVCTRACGKTLLKFGIK